MLQVARKTITTIQEGSLYEESWSAPAGDPYPEGADCRIEFLDSSGALIGEPLTGTTEKYRVWFRSSYEDVQYVPNGAGFRVFVDDDGDDKMIRYGTVFRRQLFFPNSPANPAAAAVPKRYTDTFQRPPGDIGGRWKNLRGRAVIRDHSGSLPNGVGANKAYFTRYMSRFYIPFTGDSITLSMNLLKVGRGKFAVMLSCNADGTSFRYVMFDTSGSNNKVRMGVGWGPDVGDSYGSADDLAERVTAVNHTVPSAGVGNYKLRFDHQTRAMTLYNTDYTSTILSWTDDSGELPFGKGYRYFAIGGQADVVDNTGVEICGITAQDDV